MPRTLNLEMNAQATAAFARLRHLYGVETDADVIKKALVFLDVAGEFMDDDGTLILGNGEKQKRVIMRNFKE